MANTIQSVKDLPDVSFIDNDTLQAMQARLVTNFENEYKRITGKEISLSPSDPNRIVLYAHALELYQVEQYIDRAGKQDLIKYSYGEFLDNLGAGRGVIRKQPASAKTTLRFTLSEIRPSAVGIPEGTKVTNGNLLFFKTSVTVLGETHKTRPVFLTRSLPYQLFFLHSGFTGIIFIFQLKYSTSACLVSTQIPLCTSTTFSI